VPGALYELYTNPNYVSTILLEPGETLSNIAAGDTSRWMVTQAEAESQSFGRRTIVLVKPQTTGLRTNIVLITDRRTYLIEAISQAGNAYAAQVAWSYPGGQAQSTGIPGIDRLNFGYRVRTVRGRAPVWTPTRVFDDGRRTWIEFAADVVRRRHAASLRHHRRRRRARKLPRARPALHARPRVRPRRAAARRARPTIVRIDRDIGGRR
jgi:P-type conjugative transfer protein TrbG